MYARNKERDGYPVADSATRRQHRPFFPEEGEEASGNQEGYIRHRHPEYRYNHPGQRESLCEVQPLSLYFFMPHDSHFLIFRSKFLRDLIAAIGGTVVNDDKLNI